jgi:hypothetical protein
MLTILPAGGRAERFDGIYKELLPIGEGKFLLSEAIRRAHALGADRALVISSAEKYPTHARFLSRHASGYDVGISVRSERDEHLWAALRREIPTGEAGLLVLPDTTWTCHDRIPAGADLAFGLFATDEPHRFSLVHDGRILTKPAGLAGCWDAWGCVSWSAEVARFWKEEEDLRGAYPDYDRAFEDAMREFGYGTFRIEDYCDLGTWTAYASFLRAA